jgi:hypothetical protein
MTIRGRVSRHEAGFSEPRYEPLRQVAAVLGPRLTLVLMGVRG